MTRPCILSVMSRVLALTACVAWAALMAGCDSNQTAKKVRPPDSTSVPKSAEAVNPGVDSAEQADNANQEAATNETAKDTSNEVAVSDNETTDDANENLVSGDDEGFESPLDDIPLPEEERKEVHTIDIPANWKRLGKEHEIWLDTDARQVIAGGVICLNRGALEMFICPLYTKEHESVIAVNAKSSQIHASLMALGINPGKPVQWEPDYTPVTGPKLKIMVMWKAEDGTIIKRNSREMVRDFKSKKEMDVDWVFGGSQFYTHDDGTEIYLAESGELVCVSNFATATIDVPIKSSDANMNLLYEANTEKIPEVGTKVYVIFEQLPESEQGDNDGDANRTDG